MTKWLATLSLISLTMAAPIMSQAEVMIAPTRVVLEDGKRSAELVIVNKSDEEAAFRISIENRRMNEDGSLVTATDAQSGELFAKDHVRYSPRRVIMEPGGRQTIRVSFSGADLEPGEYRSHLRLMAAPTSAGRTLQSISDDTDDGISIQLVAIRSLTIPVIARVGELNSDVEITTADLVDLNHTEGDTILEARLTRSGTESTYGDIEIYADGYEEPVYYARGIAVYTPNTERLVKLPLPKDISEQLSGKTVRVVYRSSDPKNPEVIAETETRLD